ncbi:MAG: hypothetical protein E2O68_08625 [Deltaproteobacteria bacterium]|nr:MAG: hypothetical protein E2O68_08625 [Deltaproteobacteria bacterium]
MKFFEISYFDKDQTLDMAQIRGLDHHLKTTADYFLPYPTKNGTYRWSVTGFGLLYLLQKYLSGNKIYFIFTALLFLISFKVTLELSRSPPFAYLFSYLITLGYNFFIVFFDTRVLALMPFLIYGLINFLFFYKLAIENNKSSWTKFGFTLSLILLIFCWDAWIDYGLALIVIGFLFKIKKRFYTSFLILIPLYLIVRFLLIGHLSELTGPGREQDFIFNYDNWLLGFEDFSSNIIRYIHTAITNYFPFMPLNPLVVNSARPIDLIAAFSPGATFQRDAIYYNYLYGWYLWAGITTSLYGLGVYKLIYKKKEKLSFILTSGLVFIFFGGFTHYFIKFRPLLVLPYNYTYRQFFSIVGITLIVAYLGDYLVKNKVRGKKAGISFLVAICLCFTGMSLIKTKKAIDHSFIHNKLNPPR